KDILTPEFIQLLYVSAPLHDIGKVGVPDHILLKPGPLNYNEFEEMKKHTDYGRNILVNSGRRLGGDNFLELAREIAESHHEKWDGTGYPHGLAKENIPLSGRIMMVSDVYDALTSKRCYKPAYTHEKAMQILREGRGTFFDPNVLDAFLAREPEILSITQSIRDPDI
ncbi:MAG: HD domain-containing protein, partial [Desulfocapsaceae bacterium]|nr:HD domain-containing protein [Desulfocapsaceae bacterium]